ncbi:MAG: two-component system cell cycle sensor histidine kinase/response regulator CckA [Candidatus Latescibacterota bacterium]|jgi:two-component system cell cycle sensor histidine kinase/response regulator CckA
MNKSEKRARRRPLGHSIRTRLSLMSSLVIGLIALAISILYPVWHEKQVTRTLVAKAHSITDITAFIAAPAVPNDNIQLITEAISGAREDPNLTYVAISNEAGDLIAGGQNSAYQNRHTESEHKQYHITRPLSYQGREIGQIELGYSLALVQKDISHIRSVIALVSLAIFFGGMVAVFIISTIVTRPLSQVIATADRIARGDLSKRTPVIHPEDEIGRLALSFNHMLDKLEDLNHNLEGQVELRTHELTQQIEERQKAETERAVLEEQLQQSQKMEAIGQLAGGVAHDFNNLLMLITGNNSLVVGQLDPDHPAQSNLKEIQQASDGAVSLTRQLLAFSRRQVLQPQVLNLNEIIGRLEKMLRRLIGEDVELQMTYAPELGCVTADPGQIEQVIMNLAVNARDAMEHGGKLIIETQRVDIDAAYTTRHDVVRPETYGPYVMVAVSDTGTGIDAATQQRIFEPFFTTKERGKGTGLGLSTVYGIIKQSGGYIWVYSEEGKGTSFKFYLPHVDSNIQVVELPKTKMRIGGSETILLVEDDPSVRQLCVQLLNQCGYSVLEGEHPLHAMQLCEQYEGEIHLILTDVVMPKMSGPEMVELLEPILPNAKVLFMSGYTDNAVLAHKVLKPGLSFLQKPFSLDALANKVREELDK